jgi:hypothetical protein
LLWQRPVKGARHLREGRAFKFRPRH